jgi:uncharacterized protein
LRPFIFLAVLALSLSFSSWADEKEALFTIRNLGLRQASSELEKKPTDLNETNDLKLLAKLAISFYQLFLSSQDGPTCTFSLSCSQYAKLAIERYGALKGLLMAADRLQRCHGNNKAYYSVDPATGKLDDPLP